MILLKKILLTSDLSEFSLAALDHASSLGLLYAAKLYLLYVNEHVHRKSEEEARIALEQFVTRRVSPDVKLSQVIRSGHAADKIREFAVEEGVDLIVMATHGRTGVRHALMGSVAERVVRRSPIPVLTIKPAPFRESLILNEDIENELHLR
jgi:nucleotide-binding universal stress UspA family protein